MHSVEPKASFSYCTDEKKSREGQGFYREKNHKFPQIKPRSRIKMGNGEIGFRFIWNREEFLEKTLGFSHFPPVPLLIDSSRIRKYTWVGSGHV